MAYVLVRTSLLVWITSIRKGPQHAEPSAPQKVSSLTDEDDDDDDDNNNDNTNNHGS